MKKILAAVLIFIMPLSFAACGRNTDSDTGIPSTKARTSSDSGNEIPESAVSKKTSAAVEGASVQDTRIKLTFGNEEVIVRMYDNPASRDLLAQLPLTLTFKDYAGEEKIAYPPKALSTEEAPSGADPKLGDLALYSPWGNLVIYYRDRDYANGLIILGHIESGIEKLAAMEKDFTVKIERLN